MLLKNCQYVVTQDNYRSILKNVDIKIKGNKIAAIGENLSRLKLCNEILIDGSNKIVLPGFINTHTHIGMHSLRGICDDEELELWLKKVVAKEKKFSVNDIEENAGHACDEMIRSGTTTFVEMYASIEPIIKAVRKRHIRAVLCPIIYSLLGKEKEQFAKAKKLIETQKHPRIHLGIGAHSIYTVNEALLKQIKQYAKAKKILTPIHIAETRKERFDCFDQHMKLPMEYLESIGFLDKNTLLIHAIWLTKGEVRIIGKYNSRVSHCPISNMKLSSGGVTPLMEMFDEGVTVGLGTDSVASNNTLDLFKEMMVSGLLHKHHRWDPRTMSVQKLLDMATIDGARAVNMEKDIGSIEIGKKADIITVDIGASHWPLTKENVVSHCVYATNGNMVADVIVDGILVKGSKNEKIYN